jgi:hypothetical protein
VVVEHRLDPLRPCGALLPEPVAPPDQGAQSEDGIGRGSTTAAAARPTAVRAGGASARSVWGRFWRPAWPPSAPARPDAPPRPRPAAPRPRTARRSSPRARPPAPRPPPAPGSGVRRCEPPASPAPG